MIVVVCGIKGGSGKTTIATNLVVWHSKLESKVLLVDADEQKSSSLFAAQRDGLGIKTQWTTIQLAGKDLHKQVLRLKSDYNDIIIDVGGRNTTSLRSSLLIADICLIPFCPSSYDIWTLGEMKTVINDMKTVNSNMKVCAFLNKADPNGKDNEDALEIMKECEEFESLQCTIGNRKIFRTSATDGLGIIEAKGSDEKAIKEFRNLYESIFGTKKVQKTYEKGTK